MNALEGSETMDAKSGCCPSILNSEDVPDLCKSTGDNIHGKRDTTGEAEKHSQ